MNSRDRVLAALERRRPDRPATSLRCIDEVWDRLLAHLGVPTRTAVLDELDVDLRWLSLPFIGPADRSAMPLGSEGVDLWGCRNTRVVNDYNAYRSRTWWRFSRPRATTAGAPGG